MVSVYFTATLPHNIDSYLDEVGLHTKGLLIIQDLRIVCSDFA